MAKKRVLSGLSGTRRRSSKKRGCKRVSRKKAQRRDGRLKKGCQYIKGDGAICCPPGTSRRKKKTSRRKSSTSRRKSSTARSRRKTTRRKSSTSRKKTKGHIYSLRSPLPFKKGKNGKKVLRKDCHRVTIGGVKKIRCKRKMTRRRRAA